MDERVERHSRRDEADFVRFCRFCAANWRTLAISSGVGLVLGILFFWVLPPEYSAAVVVAPVQDESEGGSSGGLSSALSQFSGAAEMLGVSLPGGSGTAKFKEFTALLTSTRLANAMIKAHDPRPMVFHKAYDWEHHRFAAPTGVMGFLRNAYATVLRQPAWQPPDAWDLSEYLKDHIVLEKDTKGGFVTITYLNRNKRFAGEFLSEVVTQADEILRSERREIAKRKIAYFDQKLQTVTMEDSRRALIGLSSNEEKALAIIETNAPYAAKFLVPTYVSSKPTFPNVFVTLIGGTVLGLFGAIGYLVIASLNWGDADEAARTAVRKKTKVPATRPYLPSEAEA